MNSEHTPSVSIVVTTYQRPALALRAIKSALAQDYPNTTILVVEDGAETELRSRLAGLKQGNVNYIAHTRNEGLAAARNTGIRCSEGDYVAFLDDDDEWMESKISEQIAIALKAGENCACVYCAAEIIGEAGEYLGENRPKLRGSIRREIRRLGLHTIPSSCLFKREALVRIGGYDVGLRSHIDHDIWMGLARCEYECDFSQKRLVKTYEHNAQRMTTDIKARIEATRLFCEKWNPELTEWYGKKEAAANLSKFQARVFLGLGTICRNNGRKASALSHYVAALKFDPLNKKCYRNLFKLVSG